MEALSLSSYVIKDKIEDKNNKEKTPLKVKDIKEVIFTKDKDIQKEIEYRLFDTKYYVENKDKPLSLLLTLKK